MSQTAVRDGQTRTSSSTPDVELRKIFKVFDDDTAVRGVDLAIQSGEFFSILGPSGCGKTTTLRLIAGFEAPTAGDLLIQGQSVVHVPPYRRPVNTVFQSYALFGHMTVWDNVAFGLRIQRYAKSAVRDRVNEALGLVKMETFAQRYPSQLSGGQQQRVALARALVNRPAVLLLDEPLGALDLKLRKEMQMELSNLHRGLGVTFVMVTHDQEEALSLSDRIAVMNDGAIEQVGSPTEIYDHPSTAFVADFIGDTNLFRGRVQQGDSTTLRVITDSGLSLLTPPATASATASATGVDAVVVSIRPENVRLALQPQQERNCFAGRLTNIMFLGAHVQYVVELESGDRLQVTQPKGSELLNLHSTVYVWWRETDGLALAT
ncbi:MAG: ABC transporter ATP-binding protein [Elainellaceae cyanobacterium]